MDNEIEKLKKDLAAAVEAGLKIAGVLKGACLLKETRDAIATLEALRPKPKPREWWVVEDEGHLVNHAWTSPQKGVDCVHVREVTPAPKWDEWSSQYRGAFGWCVVALDGTEEGKVILRGIGNVEAQFLASIRNAEMARITALWEGGAE